MDLPVLTALFLIAVALFVAGAFALAEANGKLYRVIGGLALIGASLFIAHGLDTQCPNVVIYDRC